MKPYTVSIDIDVPRDLVIELFDDVDHLPKWQTGLLSFECVSGEQGQNGAVSKLVFQNGARRIEMTETITNRDLPDAFDGTYEWSGGRNTLKNRFTALDADRTRWESTCDYEFSSFKMKMMGKLFAGTFREQNLKFMRNFKAFCEEGVDVRTGEAG
jgi:uncharacterized membrane protein